MMGYPERDSHYAHKLTRLLFKSCALLELSPHAVLLVVHIAHQEDSARYQGPIRFWNSQLMETLNFKHRWQLVKARDEAIEAGWLHYERKHDRSVGLYWTKIPRRVEKYDDAPIEGSDDSLCIPSATRGNTHGNTRSDTPSVPVPISVSVSEAAANLESENRLIESVEELQEARERIVAPKPASRLRLGVFKALEEPHISNPKALVDWHARQLSAKCPVVGDTEAHLILVLAAGLHVTGIPPPKIKNNPVAAFVSIVSRRQWRKVQAEIPAAVEQLAAIRHAAEDETTA